MTTTKLPEALQASLLQWYHAHRRKLPWREDPQPWHVMLSELMCQQTRIATVLPYYDRFLERWPTVQDFAAAPEEQVMSAWAGLGYYRRARNLHAAAKEAAARGGIPSTKAELLELPGIGPYTAGAIASIAFGEPVAAVDGNVERVLTRLHGYADNPRRAAGKRWLEARALELTGPGVAGDVTQALMELGATACSPRNPSCGACPWSEHCDAARMEDPSSLPALPARRKPVLTPMVAGVCRDDDVVFLARRAPGLFGGLWEPPCEPVSQGESPEDALRRVFRERLGRRIEVGRRVGEVRHQLTHRDLRVQVFEVTVQPTRRPPSAEGYVEQGYHGATKDLGLSRLAEKVLHLTDEAPPLWVAAAPATT